MSAFNRVPSVFFVAHFSFSLFAEPIPKPDQINKNLAERSKIIAAQVTDLVTKKTLKVDDSDFQTKLSDALKPFFAESEAKLKQQLSDLIVKDATVSERAINALVVTQAKQFNFVDPQSVSEAILFKDAKNVKPVEDFIKKQSGGKVDISQTVLIVAQGDGWHGSALIPYSLASEFTYSHPVKTSFFSKVTKKQETIDFSAKVKVSGVDSLLTSVPQALFGTDAPVFIQNVYYEKGGVPLWVTLVNEYSSYVYWKLEPKLFSREQYVADMEKLKNKIDVLKADAEKEYLKYLDSEEYKTYLTKMVPFLKKRFEAKDAELQAYAVDYFKQMFFAGFHGAVAHDAREIERRSDVDSVEFLLSEKHASNLDEVLAFLFTKRRELLTSSSADFAPLPNLIPSFQRDHYKNVFEEASKKIAK